MGQFILHFYNILKHTTVHCTCTRNISSWTFLPTDA